MKYAVATRTAWKGGPVADAPTARVVEQAALYAEVEHRTGRGSLLTTKSVGDRLRRTGRVYIAGAQGRNGVIIERVES